MSQIFYSKDHEWVAVGADGLATIGITEHAQAALGLSLIHISEPTRPY